MVQARHATWSPRIASQWAEPMPASGRATRPTPPRPTIVPIQTRPVQGWPPGRSPSSSSSQTGTVATMSAAVPLGTVFSDHITSEFPTESKSTPIAA